MTMPHEMYFPRILGGNVEKSFTTFRHPGAPQRHFNFSVA